MAEKTLTELEQEIQTAKAIIAIQKAMIQRYTLELDTVRKMLGNITTMMDRADEQNKRDFGDRV